MKNRIGKNGVVDREIAQIKEEKSNMEYLDRMARGEFYDFSDLDEFKEETLEIIDKEKQEMYDFGNIAPVFEQLELDFRE